MDVRQRGIVFWVLLTIGCSSMDARPDLERARQEIATRSGVTVDWTLDADQAEGFQRWLVAKLAEPLSMDAAVAISLLNNPKLRSHFREIGIARSDLVAAGLPDNPVFSVERRFRGTAAEFDIAQEFLGLLLIPLRKKVAESEFERERLKVTQEVWEHVAEVRTAYIHLQASEQLLEMRRGVADALSASLTAVRALREAGNIGVLEVALEEQAEGRSRIELAEAELGVVESRERVNVLLGLSGVETEWRMAGRLPRLPRNEVEFAELERLAVSERLDLASAKAEVEALSQAQELTRITSIIPEFGIGAHLEREPEGETTRGPSVSFPIPLFDFGGAERARAKYRLLQARDRYAALAIKIRSDVRSSFARMSVARSKVEYFERKLLPAYQRATDESQLLYNGMFLGVVSLVQAKRQQIDAARDYLQGISDYWITRTELEQVVGRRLPTGELLQVELESPRPKVTPHHH